MDHESSHHQETFHSIQGQMTVLARESAEQMHIPCSALTANSLNGQPQLPWIGGAVHVADQIARFGRFEHLYESGLILVGIGLLSFTVLLLFRTLTDLT